RRLVRGVARWARRAERRDPHVADRARRGVDRGGSRGSAARLGASVGDPRGERGEGSGMSESGTGLAKVNAALAPRSFAEAKEQASALARADGFVPRALLGKPHAVLAALMTGAELG